MVTSISIIGYRPVTPELIGSRWRFTIAAMPISWSKFKTKWHAYKGKESSAYQEHFNDLCRLLGQPTPAEADLSGTDFFAFQKRVVKDVELFMLKESDTVGMSHSRQRSAR